MVSFQAKIKINYTKIAPSDCFLSLKSHVKGELLPLREIVHLQLVFTINLKQILYTKYEE